MPFGKVSSVGLSVGVASFIISHGISAKDIRTNNVFLIIFIEFCTDSDEILSEFCRIV